MKRKLGDRVKSRKYNGIEYVLGQDIKKFHGSEWCKKYNKASGYANTCMCVPANDPSHNKSREQIAIYYWDYIRFANVVDYNKPTYFD